MRTSTDDRFDWRLILGCWGIVAALLLAIPLLSAAGVPRLADNDDSLRMVTATDLADGQPWQDRLERRDDAPFGTFVHWSRLVDAPLAALLLLLRPILGLRAAGDAAAYLWPPLLLLPLLLASVGLTRRLLGPGHQLAAVALPVLSLLVVGEFIPGRVDHHNVQMILTTALMWATIAGRRNGAAALAAGLLAATCLAVGLETLPFIVGAVLAFSLFWAWDAAAALSTRRFAIAFAVGVLGHFVLATPPARYLVVACDELSPPYVVAALLAAVAMLTATTLGGRLDAPRRLLLMAGLGALAATVPLLLFPACLGGPYASLDPRAFELLLARVPEAQPLWTRFAADPATTLLLASPPLIGLVVLVCCCAVTRGERRLDWLVLLLYLLLATAVMVLQLRGARLAAMPAVPAAAWLIAEARTAYLARPQWRRGTALLAAWLLFAGNLQGAVPAALAAVSPRAAGTVAAVVAAPTPTCDMAADFAALARLPAATILAPATLGSRILRYSPASVLSVALHRDVDGTIAIDDAFHAEEATARAVVADRHVAYVAVCRGGRGLPLPGLADAPASFASLLATGSHWSWLQPISQAAAPLQIFKVDVAP